MPGAVMEDMLDGRFITLTGKGWIVTGITSGHGLTHVYMDEIDGLGMTDTETFYFTRDDESENSQ